MSVTVQLATLWSGDKNDKKFKRRERKNVNDQYLKNSSIVVVIKAHKYSTSSSKCL